MPIRGFIIRYESITKGSDSKRNWAEGGTIWGISPYPSDTPTVSMFLCGLFIGVDQCLMRAGKQPVEMLHRITCSLLADGENIPLAENLNNLTERLERAR